MPTTTAAAVVGSGRPTLDSFLLCYETRKSEPAGIAESNKNTGVSKNRNAVIQFSCLRLVARGPFSPLWTGACVTF